MDLRRKRYDVAFKAKVTLEAIFDKLSVNGLSEVMKSLIKLP